MKMREHRGERLRDFFDKRKSEGYRVNLNRLMRDLGRSSKTIYNWFDMPDLPDDRIVDVYRHFPDVKDWFPEINWDAYDQPNDSTKTIDRSDLSKECKEYVASVESKYYKLLEAHNALLTNYLEHLRSAS